MSSRQQQRQTVQSFWKFKLVAWCAVVNKLFNPPDRHPVRKYQLGKENVAGIEGVGTYMLLCVSAKRS